MPVSSCSGTWASRGQEALGAVEVDLALGGAVAAAAAAYLRAGGTAVHLASAGEGPWAPTPALLESAPPGRLHVVAAPGAPERTGVVVGSAGAAHVLWSVADAGCRACLRRVTGALAPPDVLEPTSVQLGSLLALLVQRRALGLAAALEGLEVSRTGLLSALTAEACTHRPPAVPEPVLAELLRHLAAVLPDEGCAVLVGRDDRVRVVPMENAQAAQHARDPEAFPAPRGPPSASTRAPGWRSSGKLTGRGSASSPSLTRTRRVGPASRRRIATGRPRRAASAAGRGAPGHRV